jgi:hypothetical protein
MMAACRQEATWLQAEMARRQYLDMMTDVDAGPQPAPQGGNNDLGEFLGLAALGGMGPVGHAVHSADIGSKTMAAGQKPLGDRAADAAWQEALAEFFDGDVPNYNLSGNQYRQPGLAAASQAPRTEDRTPDRGLDLNQMM